MLLKSISSLRDHLARTSSFFSLSSIKNAAKESVPRIEFHLSKLNFFIIKGFQTIVFIFIVISATFRSICPPAFFRCLSNSGTFTELRTTSFIESTGADCSDSVSRKPLIRINKLRLRNCVNLLNVSVALFWHRYWSCISISWYT